MVVVFAGLCLSQSDTCGRLRDFESSIGVHSGPEKAGGGSSVLEELFWVLVDLVALLASKVVAVDECLSGAGCALTGFESCSISVEAVFVLSVVVSSSERGGEASKSNHVGQS